MARNITTVELQLALSIIAMPQVVSILENPTLYYDR